MRKIVTVVVAVIAMIGTVGALSVLPNPVQTINAQEEEPEIKDDKTEEPGLEVKDDKIEEPAIGIEIKDDKTESPGCETNFEQEPPIEEGEACDVSPVPDEEEVP